MTGAMARQQLDSLVWCLLCGSIPQELYKQIAWPLYKLYGHAFEAFKLMVADDGAAIIKRLEEERGPLTVFTPQVF